MKKLFCLVFVSIFSFAFNLLAQNAPAAYSIKGLDVAEKRAQQVRYLSLPERYRKLALPMSVDNSTKPYMRSVFSQQWYPTCMQCSSVGYTYNYEVNRVRNLPGDTSANHHAVLYTWNYANDEGDDGLDFFFTYDVIQKQGIPKVPTYGADAVEFPPTLWMNGYDKYYEAMHNRLDEVMGIKLDTEDGINTLRAWLYDHLDGSPDGGLAVFASSGYGPMYQFEEGTPEAGKSFYPNLLNYVAHGLAIVGYNDSVRYDYNHDGRYTNNVDINYDGVLDVRDWEKGAFKIVNSHGVSYADSGFAYIMYNCMTRTLSDEGVWNSSVYVINTKPSYSPELCMRIKMEHNNRQSIRLRAGIATEAGATKPTHIIEFPIFNFQGGPHAMQGVDTLAGSKQIELGLDVSELKQFAIPNTNCKFFLLVDEKDPLDMGSGKILEYSVIDYMAGGLETPWNNGELAIQDNSTTMLYVEKVLQFEKMQITTQNLPLPVPNQTYQVQLEAEGGVAPYSWALNYPYQQSAGNCEFTSISLADTIPEGVESNIAIKLPFSFPFFGKAYDTVYMNRKGMLVLTADQLPPRYFDDYLFLLKNNAVINPGFRDEYEIFTGDGDGMWYGFNGDTAIFRWRLSVLNSEPATEAYFEAKLMANGEVRFDYMTMELFDELVVNPGISAGNGRQFLLSDDVSPAILTQKSFTYTVANSPKQVELTDEGLLSIQQYDSVYVERVDVEVFDQHNNGHQKRFYLSDGLDFEVVPAAGPGALALFNQQTKLNLKVVNRTLTPFSAVEFKLKTRLMGVQLVDSLEVLNNLPSGSTQEFENAFSLEFTQAMMGGQVVELEVWALYNGSKRILRMPLVVGAPFVMAGAATVHDGENAQLDPGETAWVEFQIQNAGNKTAGAVQAEIQCNDPHISLLSANQILFDSITINEQKSFRCLVNVSPEIALADSVLFEVKLTYGPGLDSVCRVKLQVGSYSVALVNLSNQSASIDSMAAILTKLSIPFQTLSYMPASLKAYKTVFLCLGSVTPAHTLTESESARIISYLSNGGHLYIEGYYFMFFPGNSVLPAWLNFTLQSVPLYYYKTVLGVEGIATEGMEFKNASAKTVSIKEIVRGNSAFSFLQSPEGKPIQITVANEGYRAIASAIDFGALTDSLAPSTKYELMKTYLDFFEIDTTGLSVFFHADKIDGCVNHGFNFIDDSFGSFDSYAWQFPGGNPGFSTIANPTVNYVEPGVYDVILTVTKGELQRTITKLGYIEVSTCAGIEAPLQQDVQLFPNPAKGVTTLRFASPHHGFDKCELFDATGKLLRRIVVASESTVVSLDVQGVKAGFYILSLSNQNGQRLNLKLVVK